MVDLVGGDHDGGAAVRARAERIQDICGAHDIGCKCLQWFAVAEADERLRREMQEDLRVCGFDQACRALGIADVADVVVTAFSNVGFIEDAWCRGWFERDSGDICAELRQPERKPAAFEAGVPRDNDALSLPEAGCHCVSSGFRSDMRGQRASFPDIPMGSSGHSIPNAGSSHRTPRSQPGV